VKRGAAAQKAFPRASHQMMNQDTLDISAVIITLDEERNIRRCLESLTWAREIVVVDSGSTDATVEIAREYTDRVISQPFEGYVGQKNFALDQATGEWILSVDADEMVTPELLARIREVWPRERERYNGFTINRLSRFSGRWIRHCGWYPDRKLRLFRRSRGHWEGDDLHERVRLDGPVMDLNADLLHYTYQDLSENIEKIQRYSTIFARAQYARGRRASLWDLMAHPPAKFLKSYLLKRGFLDGRHGLILSVTAAFYVFLKYAKLWELQKTTDESQS
jgi:glycosyltransferase involved in cell wall biosynthesis